MKNRYEIRGEEIILFLDKRDGSVMETKVSLDKLPRLLSFTNKWGSHLVQGKWYVKASKPGTIGGKVDLHRFITDAPKGTKVDHVNGDTLDNTNHNLNIVEDSENGQNRHKLNDNNTSGQMGVWQDARNGRWCAEIWKDRKKIYLGKYDTIEEATVARLAGEKKYFDYKEEIHK